MALLQAGHLQDIELDPYDWEDMIYVSMHELGYSRAMREHIRSALQDDLDGFDPDREDDDPDDPEYDEIEPGDDD